MSIAKETVEYVANLSRIKLDAGELEKISAELGNILDFIGKLKGVNTDNVAPTSHILPVNNVLRQDENDVSLSAQKALENSPKKEENFFVVPKVIE